MDKKMTSEEFMSLVLNTFISGCLDKAEKNWCPAQIDMLIRLFAAEITDKDYDSDELTEVINEMMEGYKNETV